MRIVIEDNVDRNQVSVRIVGQSADLNFMDALIGSLNKLRSFNNGKSKENPNQMKFVPVPELSSKRRRR